MPKYVLLMSYTPAGLSSATKGARSAAQVADAPATGTSITRLRERLQEKLKLFNAGLTDFYWLLGGYDMIAIVEADTDAAVAGVALWLAAEAGVQTTTMPAYSSDAIGTGSAGGSLTVASVLYRCYADSTDGD